MKVTKKKVTESSVKSLFVEMYFNETKLSTGTAFVACSAKGPVLITNRHNVTGRDQNTNKPISPTCGIPNQVIIWHNAKGQLGHWTARSEPLYSDRGFEQPRWIEHPTLGSSADFVALPLTQLDGVDLYSYDLQNPGPNIFIGVTETVSVIGFPFGLSAGGKLPIWATGFIASEPDVDYDGLPVLLIDCRSREGQSGSPVVAYRSGGAISMADGGTNIGPGTLSELIGIYSGRIHKESDIGRVWKTKAIFELLQSL